METKRLFLAIPLPEEIISYLTHYLVPYKQHHTLKKGTWCDPKNLHITTLFLGDVKVAKIPEIEALLKNEFLKVHAFHLIFDKIHFFPSQKKTHMIWASYQEREEFSKLVESLQKALQLEEEPHKPIPHITLVRLKHIFVKEKIYFNPIQLPDLEVNSCELYSSELTNKGPIYTLIQKFSLCTNSAS